MDELDESRQIELERRRRARGIALTVQVWYEDGGVRKTQPRSITLREGDRLFSELDRLVPCEFWGSLQYQAGDVFYSRPLAPDNTWAAWTDDSPYLAAEYVDRRQVYISADSDNDLEIPWIMLQDIRHIEKMPTDAAHRLGQMQGLLAGL